MRKTVVFCGGGSGGHVIPALTLIDHLQRYYQDLSLCYIGSAKGIERGLVEGKTNVLYRSIATGKLRRYFSLENFIDLFKVSFGTLQSFFFLLKLKLTKNQVVVMSTGGFVTVPVVVAARLLGIPIFVHEQTSRAGLANAIAAKFATKIFISFEESRRFFPAIKTELSGYPLREDCFTPPVSTLRINEIQVYPHQKPLLFVTGGGNGSALVNKLVLNNLSKLTERFVVVHQVGAHFIKDFEGLGSSDYLPLSFVHGEMLDLMKLSEVIISRAGAGTVAELLALSKRSIFIPLKIAQKNEQYHNAMEAVKRLNSSLVEEDQLTQIDLMKLIDSFLGEKGQIFKGPELKNATAFICAEIAQRF